MSDDEEMSDLSQRITQSGSIVLSQFTPNNNEPTPEPWGQITIYTIGRKRLGVRNVANYNMQKMQTLDLVQEKTTFGRNCRDCNLSEFIDSTKINEISATHFTITKNNVTDPLCAIFLEDTSSNGTFFLSSKQSQDLTGFRNGFERIDPKVKRRILAHKDFISIEKKPTICFQFHHLNRTSNELNSNINEEYHIGCELGRGACGVVYFAQNRKTCQPFALKYTSSENDENTISTILKEVSILDQIKHPCILQLFTVKTYINSVAIFIDFMPGGDLLGRLKKCERFSESLAKFFFYQICCAIDYLHSQNVVHRDLKPENILLATADEYTLLKVSDFGLSKRSNINSVLQTQCGTIMYLAPEVRTRKYTNKVDVWSLGVVLYNFFTGRYPFRDPNKFELKFEDPIWQNISCDGKSIVSEMLNVNAEKRPPANELLKRMWLSQSDESIQRASETMRSKFATR